MRAVNATDQRIGIILLAAGASRRFGRDKLREKLGSRPLIEWSIEAAKGSGLAPLLVVVRPGQSPPSAEVNTTVNPRPREGLSSSIRCGLAVASQQSWSAAILAPADQPLLSPAVFMRLAKAFEKGAEMAVATYRGHPRNPVLLAPTHWQEAMRLSGETGLAAMTRSGKAVEVECGDVASVNDMDTPADMEKLLHDPFFRVNLESA